MEKHRAQAGLTGLPGSEHGIPAAGRQPAIDGPVNAEDAPHLVRRRGGIGDTADLGQQAAVLLLPDDHPRLMRHVIGDEGEPHQRPVRVRPTGVRPEPEGRRGGQRERPLNGETQAHWRPVPSGVLIRPVA